VRKYLRSDCVEPEFDTPDRPSGLDLFADKLAHVLRQEAGKSRKQKRTVEIAHGSQPGMVADAQVARKSNNWCSFRPRSTALWNTPNASRPLSLSKRRLIHLERNRYVAVADAADPWICFATPLARRPHLSGARCMQPRGIGSLARCGE